MKYSDDAWIRLSRLIRTRRKNDDDPTDPLSLGMTQVDVQSHGGPSVPVQKQFEAPGNPDVSPNAREVGLAKMQRMQGTTWTSVEQVLRLQQGAVREILANPSVTLADLILQEDPETTITALNKRRPIVDPSLRAIDGLENFTEAEKRSAREGLQMVVEGYLKHLRSENRRRANEADGADAAQGPPNGRSERRSA